MQVLFKVCYIPNLNLPRIAQYLKHFSKIAKVKVNIILLFLRVQGHLNVWLFWPVTYIHANFE